MLCGVLASYNRHRTPGSLVDDLSKSWCVLCTTTSIAGCGTMVSPLPFWCHCCNTDVQACFGCISSSFSESLTILHSYKVNLQTFVIKADISLLLSISADNGFHSSHYCEFFCFFPFFHHFTFWLFIFTEGHEKCRFEVATRECHMATLPTVVAPECGVITSGRVATGLPLSWNSSGKVSFWQGFNHTHLKSYFRHTFHSYIHRYWWPCVSHGVSLETMKT